MADPKPVVMMSVEETDNHGIKEFLSSPAFKIIGVVLLLVIVLGFLVWWFAFRTSKPVAVAVVPPSSAAGMAQLSSVPLSGNTTIAAAAPTVAAAPPPPPPQYQWDGNGQVIGVGGALITANGVGVTQWLPNTTNTGIWSSATPTGYLQVGPPRGLHTPVLTLSSPAPMTATGNCVFVVVRMNSIPPSTDLTILHLSNNKFQFNWSGGTNQTYYYYNTTGVSVQSPVCPIGTVFVVGLQITSTDTKIVWDPTNANNILTVPHKQAITPSTDAWTIGYSGSALDFTIFEVAVYGSLSATDLSGAYQALRTKWKAP